MVAAPLGEAAAGGRQSSRPSRAEYGSDYIVELLRALDVPYCAFNPGASFRGVHDSLVNFDPEDARRPGVIQVCHEEISVALAHGYYRATGRPMVAIAHDVVGLQHATMAIFNAWVDRAPVLVLGGTGPMDSTQRRPWIDWIHTANVQGNLVRDYVKFDDQPATLLAVSDSLFRAYRTMLVEPPGPVYVCLDTTVQEQEAPQGLRVPDPGPFVETSRPGADLTALARAADLLASAARPAIVAGRVGRHPESVAHLAALAEVLGAPVLSTDERYNLPSTHPLNLTGASAEMLAEADLVLALDVWDLAHAVQPRDRGGQNQPALSASARIVEIKLSDLAVRSWSHDFQSMMPVDLSILADTSVCLPELVVLLRQRIGPDAARAGRRSRLEARHTELRAAWRAEAERRVEEKPVSLAAMADAVWEAIKNDDWVLAYHSHNPWPHRIFDFDAPYRYASGPTGGGVGGGIGIAAGVALAHRGTGRIVVDLQADGDLLYATSALWTIAHERLPLLMVMHNNRSYYNSAEHGQRTARRRGRPVENYGIGTGLEDPAVDFATVARGFGIWSEGPIEDVTSLRGALQRALAEVRAGRPALLDVVTQAR